MRRSVITGAKARKAQDESAITVISAEVRIHRPMQPLRPPMDLANDETDRRSLIVNCTATSTVAILHFVAKSGALR